jgi:hypothetical protein
MIYLASLETRLRSKIPRDYTGRKNLLSRRHRKEKPIHRGFPVEIESANKARPFRVEDNESLPLRKLPASLSSEQSLLATE